MSHKPLGKPDSSGADFAIRALAGDVTRAFNFDRIQYSFTENRYLIFEYCKVNPDQFPRGITPYTSHPNRYWEKCSLKFILTWKIAQALNARFFIVNYADPWTEYGNQVRLMEVQEIKDHGITKYQDFKTSFDIYSKWFRKKNAEGNMTNSQAQPDLFSVPRET